ncbi:arsenate reductase/protein-tyrosine-phosphatase family protein [Rugamonas apoptosis]|uniref:Phosphotyrosine protein phosphatase I domain-containing protein n=1 Tax=Rugamonas apoptosis TaxID=2758570 RepID=A0A7W2F7G9_9BURK|nr:hypothetical protein [Rugamonas apoptosis]MBA5686548.1 hypothetical protein [Rugamonas apoptosis]
MKVLFLCTGNSCRSILGEATFNRLAPPTWRAMSARIEAWLALPLYELAHDKAKLKTELDRIGALTA